MKKEYFAGILAAGLGAAAITTNVEAASMDVFGVQPREIRFSFCESQTLSLQNLQRMIQNRNEVDIDDVRSSIDDMLHL